MEIINEYNAITNENISLEVTQKVVSEIREGITNTTTSEIELAKTAVRNSAMSKLAALGLTEDEAKAIIS